MNNENWGAWYIVAVVAAVIAVTECGAAVVVINRPEVIAGFDLASWVPPVVSAVAIVLAIVVAAATALGAVPRRHTIAV